MIESLAGSPLVHAIGLSLLEFLWQGAAIGAVGGLLLFSLRRASAQARYLVACAALACMAAMPVVTVTAYLSNPASPGRVPGLIAAFYADSDREAVSGHADGTGAGVADTLVPANPDGVAAWPVYGRLPLVVLLWSIGVLVLTAHLLRGWLVVRRLRRTAADLAAGPWPSILRSLAERFGVRGRVRLIESARASVPFVVGWLQPVIVVPASVLAGLPPAHVEAILAHELIHVRRGDYLVNVAQCVVETLLFYHPAVWWVSRQIRIEREHSCDDTAVAASIDPHVYAQALMSLELLRNRPAFAMAADGGDLLVRVRRLMAPGSCSTQTMSGGLAMCTVLTILLLAVGGPLSGMPIVIDQNPAGRRAAEPVSRVPEPMREVTIAIPTAGTPAVAAPTHPRRPQRVVMVRADTVANEAVGQGAVTTARATLSGVVVDGHGLPVPGATVTLSRSLGGSRSVPTNAVGKFVMADLAPGDYELAVSHNGFKAYRAKASVGSTPVAVQVHLEVGSMSEAMTVRRDAGSFQATFEVGGPADPAADLAAPVAVLPPAVVVPVPYEEVVTPPRPVRIGGAVAPPRRLGWAAPEVPAGVVLPGTGVAIIEATIGTDGAVKNVRVLRSVPGFDQAALTAVSQWRYTPGLLNGRPIDVNLTVTANFAE